MIINYWRQMAFAASLLASAYLGYQWADNSWQSDWDAHMLADAEANRKAAGATLTKQQNLLQELDNAYKTANDLQKKHDSNVADARVAADRLRAELDRIKALPAITHTSTIAERANAATDRRVLAVLLGESDARAGEYAQETDRLRLIVVNCNAEYNAVRTALNER